MKNNIEDIKVCRYFIVILSVTILIIFGSYVDIKQTNKECLLNINKDVIEYIYNRIGETSSDEEVIEYYNSHRIECSIMELDSI